MLSRTIDLTDLIPKTTNAKAGRTLPIKFTLRTNPLIDASKPFVYNEGLTIDIRILGASNPSQISVFGIDSKSYRIDTEAELYIVNFKTAPNPAIYKVTISMGSQIIGIFTFSTTR